MAKSNEITAPKMVLREQKKKPRLLHGSQYLQQQNSV